MGFSTDSVTFKTHIWDGKWSVHMCENFKEKYIISA